ERLGGPRVEELDGGGRDVGAAIALRLQEVVEADGLGLGCDVLESGEDRAIACVAQGVEDVLLVIVEREAAVREAEHAVLVRELAGEERGAARGAGGRATEGLAEEDSFARELLQVRRGDGVA